MARLPAGSRAGAQAGVSAWPGRTLHAARCGSLNRAPFGAAQLEESHRFGLGRMGTPDEVGYLALFLVSREASFINGQVIEA